MADAIALRPAASDLCRPRLRAPHAFAGALQELTLIDSSAKGDVQADIPIRKVEGDRLSR